MSTQSETDYDASISSSKIEPLGSPMKVHIPHTDHGVIGEDADIEHTHLEPLDSPIKEHHRTLSLSSDSKPEVEHPKKEKKHKHHEHHEEQK
ncbi:hypothetical protein BCR34DRAFT_603412 [Clohesyomyces aquaticus]|uniref:Uncharacterized protein n=1 Tax=Clohesyomyces aquaticus TaxID=1231657 RepID=A0A1Y1ZEK6_9PLEO|nr:hypothetical protein BCR34DRAFT_603412 [Clohesyomyces aquaticus]